MKAKRSFAIFIALSMLLSLVPAASAAIPANVPEKDVHTDVSEGVLNVNGCLLHYTNGSPGFEISSSGNCVQSTNHSHYSLSSLHTDPVWFEEDDMLRFDYWTDTEEN